MRRSRRVNSLAVIWLDFLHQVAVAVVDKLGRLSTDCDRNQSILSIEGLGISQATFHASNHIAICIAVVGQCLVAREALSASLKLLFLKTITKQIRDKDHSYLLFRIIAKYEILLNHYDSLTYPFFCIS